MHRRFLILLLVCSFTDVLLAQELSIFASPSGKGNRGTLKEPGSLEGARNKVRTLNRAMTANIIVCLRGGDYKLTRSFALTEQDGGSNGFRVFYKAYGEEKPVLSGSKKL